MRKYLSHGFTLVELLIVIALLGVIATIVIAAINPIEQSNRATDAGKKADASQIVSAIERYYSAHSMFPWQAASCAVNGGTVCSPVGGAEAEIDWLSADDPSIGICGAKGACKTTTNQGELVSSLELNSAFLSKSWVNPPAAPGVAPITEELLVGKGPSSSDAVYVCWTPKSNSNKQNLITAAKVVNATGAFTTAVPPAGTCTKTSDAGWKDGTCVECVPE